MALIPASITTQQQTQQQVRVGIGVLVKDPRNPRNIFAGRRKNSHGAGTIALPGGHLEMYETWEECAIREVKEETNLNIHNVSFGHVTNDPMVTEGKHYITIFMTAEVSDDIAEPQNMEPHKCDGWLSYSWDDLNRLQTEKQLFGPLKHLLIEKPKAILDFIQS